MISVSERTSESNVERASCEVAGRALLMVGCEKSMLTVFVLSYAFEVSFPDSSSYIHVWCGEVGAVEVGIARTTYHGAKEGGVHANGFLVLYDNKRIVVLLRCVFWVKGLARGERNEEEAKDRQVSRTSTYTSKDYLVARPFKVSQLHVHDPALVDGYEIIREGVGVQGRLDRWCFLRIGATGSHGQAGRLESGISRHVLLHNIFRVHENLNSHALLVGSD